MMMSQLHDPVVERATLHLKSPTKSLPVLLHYH